MPHFTLTRTQVALLCGKIPERFSSDRDVLEFLCRGLESNLQLKAGAKGTSEDGLCLLVCHGSLGGTDGDDGGV